MPAALVLGSTGAVGSQILATLLSSPSYASVTTISRRAPSPQATTRFQPMLEGDINKWGDLITTLSPHPSVVYDAIGTTLAAAGSIAQQRTIDHDLCVSNAKAAKAAGAKTYVYCSSGGTSSMLSPFAWSPYAKMKRAVEATIRELSFDHAVILRPGMILDRETPKYKWLEDIFNGLRVFGQGVTDRWGQDQKVIGRAAVAAVKQIDEGTVPSKVWVLEQSDIVRLGRTEWKE